MQLYRCILLCLSTAVASQAQTRVTFTPSHAPKLSNTLWTITACVPTTASPGVIVRAGDIYSKMAQHKIDFLLPSDAVAALQAAPSKTWIAQGAKWGGYLSAGAAFLMTTDTVKASTTKTAVVTAISGGLNVIVPLATKEVPGVQTGIQAALLGTFLVVPGGQCSIAIVLGDDGDKGIPFEETM